jgi:protein arginine kinase activator
MLCDECRERDAVVHLTKVVDTGVAQVHLCEHCAAAAGIETASQGGAPHPLHGLLQAAQQQKAQARDAARCAYCGTSQAEFRTSGRLGCAHCYGAFTESLRELVKRVHGEARHVGRRYEPPNPADPPRRTVATLREELAEAIAREEFERAAALRDALRGME